MDEINDVDIKVCPFCGNRPEVWKAAPRKWIHIQCRQCDMAPHIEDFSKRAIRSWNRRHKS